MSKKAQLAVIDMIIAVSIFTFLVISIIFIWSNYLTRLDAKVDLNRMQEKAFQITNNLVKTPGIPAAWNSTNVIHIGLATKDRVLSKDKVGNFTDLPYSTARNLFNLEYDFYFNLSYLNKTSIKEYGSIPKNNIVNLQRTVLYENKNATMQFALWK